MKKVLILFGEKNWESAAFKKENDGYKLCYEHLYRLAEENGVRLYRASYKWFDVEKKLFLNAWTFKNDRWLRVHDIKPDLIFDKTSSKPETAYFKSCIANTTPIVNDIEFTDLIDNKLFTSLLFSEHCKKHYKVIDRNDLNSILKQIKTDRIVLKTSTDSGGRNVFIFKKNLTEEAEIPFPILAQEFIDSSHGIEGISNSTHDLRLVFIENELIYSYIRTPAEGSFLANLAQGGSMKIIPNDHLPNSLDDLVSDVQNKLSTFKNKMYTIDIMFDEGQKPWIIELNSMPGLFFEENQHEERNRVYTALIKLLKKS